jgi:hypothetical protein
MEAKFLTHAQYNIPSSKQAKIKQSLEILWMGFGKHANNITWSYTNLV